MINKKNISKGIFIFFIIATLVFSHFIQLVRVSGTSMNPTFRDKQILLMKRQPEAIHRYDNIVFCVEEQLIIKRVIGLPGETIFIDNGQIFVNDELLKEPIAFDLIQDPGVAGSPITLGEGEYFVLGDNRNGSVDSRAYFIGPVHTSQIEGKVLNFNGKR